MSGIIESANKKSNEDRYGLDTDAMDAIGGWQRIRMRTPFDEQKIRAEFCNAFATSHN